MLISYEKIYVCIYEANWKVWQNINAVDLILGWASGSERRHPPVSEEWLRNWAYIEVNSQIKDYAESMFR